MLILIELSNYSLSVDLGSQLSDFIQEFTPDDQPTKVQPAAAVSRPWGLMTVNSILYSYYS